MRLISGGRYRWCRCGRESTKAGGPGGHAVSLDANGVLVR